MTAGGISQIIEQIARVLTAIGLAYVRGWVTMIPGLRPAPPSGRTRQYRSICRHAVLYGKASPK